MSPPSSSSFSGRDDRACIEKSLQTQRTWPQQPQLGTSVHRDWPAGAVVVGEQSSSWIKSKGPLLPN